jgi:adenine-specific DNA-methyltransferase
MKRNNETVSLEWNGKDRNSSVTELKLTPVTIPPNRLYLGDNKSIMSSLLANGLAGAIHLIYIDPPFFTGNNLRFAASPGIKQRGRQTYTDSWGKSLDSYLQMMYERLALMNELLSEDGSIYIHLDDHVNHYVKIIMDELFGRHNLVNQIIWQRTGAHNDPQAFGRNYDVILFYQKSARRKWNRPLAEYDEAHIARYFQKDADGRWHRLNNPTGKGYQDHQRDFGYGPIKPPRDRHWSVPQEQVDRWLKENRIVYTSSGYPIVIKYLDEMPGKRVQSIWTDLIPPRSSKELTGFPTQKPEKLLRRIITASSDEGDLVADFFCGSGTTLVAAEKLGRRWIGCDSSSEAINITAERLNKIKDVRPFEVSIHP